jgi:hypothetical protein
VGCNWDVETRNLAYEPSMAPRVEALGALLRKGWRGALPPVPPSGPP